MWSGCPPQLLEVKKKQSYPLVLIFIHIPTYLEEELARRHRERLLRATSTSAIFTKNAKNTLILQDQDQDEIFLN